MSNYHMISEDFGGGGWCSCGVRFSSAMEALDHALPLNTRSLADQVAADSNSSPDLISSTEELAQRAARLSHDQG